VTLLSGPVVGFNCLTNDNKTRPSATSLLDPATMHSRLPEALCDRQDSNFAVFFPVTATVLYIENEAMQYACFFVVNFTLRQLAEGRGWGGALNALVLPGGREARSRKRPSAPVWGGQSRGVICEYRKKRVLKGTLQRVIRQQKPHGIGLQLGWRRPGSTTTSWHGPREFGFYVMIWRTNPWNTPTIGRAIIWRGH